MTPLPYVSLFRDWSSKTLKLIILFMILLHVLDVNPITVLL